MGGRRTGRRRESEWGCWVSRRGARRRSRGSPPFVGSRAGRRCAKEEGQRSRSAPADTVNALEAQALVLIFVQIKRLRRLRHRSLGMMLSHSLTLLLLYRHRRVPIPNRLQRRRDGHDFLVLPRTREPPLLLGSAREARAHSVCVRMSSTALHLLVLCVTVEVALLLLRRLLRLSVRRMLSGRLGIGQLACVRVGRYFVRRVRSVRREVVRASRAGVRMRRGVSRLRVRRMRGEGPAGLLLALRRMGMLLIR